MANPYHDKLGRFTSKSGRSSGGGGKRALSGDARYPRTETGSGRVTAVPGRGGTPDRLQKEKGGIDKLFREAGTYNRKEQGKAIAATGGGGKSLRQTVQKKRSIGANRRYEESAAAKNLDGKAGAAKSDIKAGKWYREIGKPRVGDGARVPSGASGRKAGLAKGGSPAAGTQTKRFTNAGGSSSERSQAIAKGYNRRQERNANASIAASSRRASGAKSGDSVRKIVKAKTSGVGPNKTYSSLLNPKTGKGGSVNYRQKPGYETTAQVKNSNTALAASTKLNKKK